MSWPPDDDFLSHDAAPAKFSVIDFYALQLRPTVDQRLKFLSDLHI
jgi:hypothetical protein